MGTKRKTTRKPWTKLCPKCKKYRAAREFFTNANTGKRLANRIDTCISCRLNVVKPRSTAPWDWADGLLKSVLMSQARAKVDKSCRLDTPCIRALYELQEGRCALTGIPIILPKRTDILTVGATLSNWRKSLPKNMAGFTPALVCGSEDDDWSYGNTVIIIRALRDFALLCRGAIPCHGMLKHNKLLVIPTMQSIINCIASSGHADKI